MCAFVRETAAPEPLNLQQSIKCSDLRNRLEAAAEEEEALSRHSAILFLSRNVMMGEICRAEP